MHSGERIGTVADNRSPTLDDVEKTIVPFVKEGKPNTATPHILFDWGYFNTTVLTEAPVAGMSFAVQSLLFMS